MRRVRPLAAALCALALLSVTVPGAAASSGSTNHPTDPVPGAAADESMDALDLRVLLGRLLGEHSFLLLDAMRAQTTQDEAAEAVTAALDENSEALTGAITSVYGEEAGGQFGALWDEHIGLLIDYADATRAGDDARRQAAEQGLEAYSHDLGEALASLNPALTAHEETEALELHIEQVRAFADGDFTGAYAAHRAAFQHMFELGDHLALEIARQFPDRFPGGAVAFSPRADLRLALDRLLAEHLVLAAQAMRAGVTESGDFDAAAASLGQNTDELSGAIAGIYGAGAGDQFKDVWEQHIAAYVGFVLALGSGDPEARSASLSALHAYHDQIAGFLAEANPELDEAAVADLIRRHVQALITQAEATASEDMPRAIAATRDGYDGTFEVGAALADAIAAQFPDRFQDLKELPPTDTLTGAGGLDTWVLVLVLAAMAVMLRVLGEALARNGSREAARDA